VRAAIANRAQGYWIPNRLRPPSWAACADMTERRNRAEESAILWWIRWGYGAQSSRVHAEDLQDRAAVALVLEGLAQEFPPLEHLWVDQGYSGTGKAWIEKHLGWSVGRWSTIRPSCGASGNHAAISTTSQPSGLSG
jgi:hypothetical protein